MTDDKPAPKPFSMLIQAIEEDLEQKPEGRGGEIHYTPATPGHGGMGQNGDYLLREWREALAAVRAEHDEALSLAHQYANQATNAETERDEARATAWADAAKLARAAEAARSLGTLPDALEQCAREAANAPGELQS